VSDGTYWTAAEPSRCLTEAKKPDEAKRRFQRIIDEFPDTSYQLQARIELGKLSPVFAN